jgi:hypothetical protein
VFLQRLQALAHQRTAGVGLGRDQLGAAVREVEHLQRAGMLDQPGDVLGHQRFRADQDIDRAVLRG